jgi:transcriptional regulator with XRE-family HTH domain
MTQMAPGRVPVFTLGERIRKAREDMALSQQEFAARMGVDRKSISNWESGRHAPRHRDLLFMAVVSGVDLDWLTGEDPPVSPPGSAPVTAQSRSWGGVSLAWAA